MIKPYDQIQLAAERAGLPTEPVGWRRDGITVWTGVRRVAVDLGRDGGVLGWALYDGGTLVEQAGKGDLGKLQAVLDIVESFVQED